MTYWLTITFIVSLAIFVTGINGDEERLNGGADTKTNSLTDETSKDSSLGDSLNKRASFMPSRGKKEQEFEGTADGGADKRAAAAFMPMRGRKDYYNPNQAQAWYVGGPQSNYQGGMDEKRAGFMPMRGRKNSAYDQDMKAPAAYFYNDVYPLELNDMKRMAAFMPMRGRKDDMAYDQMYGQPPYAVPQTQPYYQSTQNIDNTNWMEGEHSLTANSRGGPSAIGYGPELQKKANNFFSSRGKRSATLNDIKSETKRSTGEQSPLEDNHRYNENFFAARG